MLKCKIEMHLSILIHSLSLTSVETLQRQAVLNLAGAEYELMSNLILNTYCKAAVYRNRSPSHETASWLSKRGRIWRIWLTDKAGGKILIFICVIAKFQVVFILLLNVNLKIPSAVQVFSSIAKELLHKEPSGGVVKNAFSGKQVVQKRSYNPFRSEEIPSDPHRQVLILISCFLHSFHKNNFNVWLRCHVTYLQHLASWYFVKLFRHVRNTLEHWLPIEAYCGLWEYFEQFEIGRCLNVK